MLDRCEKCGREYGEHAGTKCPPPREEYDTRQHHPKQMKMPWEK